MIILQLSVPEILGFLMVLALLLLAAVIASYCLGAGSVNVELEVLRKTSGVNLSVGRYHPPYKYQPHQRCSSPPPPPPPKRP